MPVVLYSHSSRLGGAELAAPALAEQLDAELWTRAEQLCEQAELRGLRWRRLPPVWDRRPRGAVERLRAALSTARAQGTLYRSLRRSRPEVVVANNLQAVLHLALGCRLAGIPLVVYVRDLGQGGNRSASEVRVYRALLSAFATGCIFNSNLTRQSWGLPARVATTVAPTAVPDVFFDRPHRPLPDEVLMLGRIAAWKGQAQVVRALNLLQPDRPVRLRLVGGAQFADEVDLPPATFSLEVTGHVDDPWAALDTAAVFVHASLTPEPFGQVVAQAAAAGVPIVCSDRGGQMEWLEDGVSCLAVDPHDTRALASAIASALADPAAAHRRALVARSRAEDFRERNAYAALRVWLEQVLARASGRGVLDGTGAT